MNPIPLHLLIFYACLLGIFTLLFVKFYLAYKKSYDPKKCFYFSKRAVLDSRSEAAEKFKRQQNSLSIVLLYLCTGLMAAVIALF